MTTRRHLFVVLGTVASLALAAMSPGTGGSSTRKRSMSDAKNQTQESRILVAPIVAVSQANLSRPHWEVQIATDPTDTKRLIACSIMLRADDMNAARTYLSPRPLDIVVYSSVDGGQNWHPSYELDKQPFNIDPTCAFGPDGTAYLMSFGGDVYSVTFWARQRVTSSESTKGFVRTPKHLRMVMYRSSDGGKSWKEAGEAATSDRDYVTVDDTSGPYRGRVYVHGISGTADIDGEQITSLAAFHSTDQGQTFESVKLAAEGSQYFPANGNGVVMSDGTFATIFGEIPDPQTAGFMHELHPASPNATLKFVSSNDGGETFDKATVISEWYLRLNGTLIGMPSLAVDRTHGPFQNRLYAAWVDARSGRGEIRFARSDDKGKTWFPSFVISDNWPRDPSGEAPDAFLPTLAVNRNGVLGVLWYDRREHRDNLGYDIRFSASLDGGESFVPSVPVAAGGGSALQMKEALLEGPFLLSANPDGRQRAGFNWSYFDSGGDTAGLACDVDGVFHPLWSDRRSGVQQVSTTRITVNGTAMPNGGSGLESLRDLSANAEVHYSLAHLDIATNVVTIGAAIYNRSNEPLPMPVTMRVLGLSSNSGPVEAENSDNGVNTSGAAWTFHATSGDSLQPGTLSAPRQLQFKFSRAPFPPTSLTSRVDRGVIEIDTKLIGQ